MMKSPSSVISCFVWVLVVAISTTTIPAMAQQLSGPLALLNFLDAGGERLRYEKPDQRVPLPEYDFVIVGAGSAGCVLANRLSEVPHWKVLLIEAGPQENLLMDIPMMVHYLQNYAINWDYRTKPSNSSCLGFKNNQCRLPRGKIMGGSSVLNYMVYTRGNRRDYDQWARLGNPGWSYKDVLPYFRKLERSRIPNADPAYAGRNGPQTISYPDYRSDIATAFVKASIAVGLPYVDYNGRTQIGTSYVQTTTKGGRRESTNSAYLYPIHDRPNLHIRRNAHVTKLLIDRRTNRTIGVQFYADGRYRKVGVRHEVVLSAGTIGSPQLLMLSGVGPAKHLRQKGIDPIVNLAVGYNFQDHVAAGALTFLVNRTETITSERMFRLENLEQFQHHHRGLLTSTGGCEAITFYDSDHPATTTSGDGWPDLELLLIGGTNAAEPVFQRNFNYKPQTYERLFGEIERRQIEGYSVFPLTLRPRSRGRIRLASADPFEHPIIVPNYLADPYDLDRAVRGIRKAIELSRTGPLQRYGARLLEIPMPGCEQFRFDSDEYWKCFARHATYTIYHHVGTCKMGPESDRMAVVDARLRVRGISGLRVIDASIMPMVPAGHTNGPTIMIGEKGADMIKQDWNVPIRRH